jgi:hypothetical protein
MQANGTHEFAEKIWIAKLTHIILIRYNPYLVAERHKLAEILKDAK